MKPKRPPSPTRPRGSVVAPPPNTVGTAASSAAPITAAARSPQTLCRPPRALIPGKSADGPRRRTPTGDPFSPPRMGRVGEPSGLPHGPDHDLGDFGRAREGQRAGNRGRDVVGLEQQVR